MLNIKFWSFSGKNEDGKVMRGVIDAPNKAIARYSLHKIGIKKIYYLFFAIASYKKIFYLTNKEKLHLFFNISLQINAGLSLFESLESIKLDASTFNIKYLLFLVLKNLHEGHRLSDSFEKIAYNPLTKTEIGLIKAAEISGNLDVTLKFICEKLGSTLLIKQKIISALIYPVITLMISLIVIFIIFKWVIPQFEIIFSQNNRTLPRITEYIFVLSKHINTVFISLILFVIIFDRLIRLLIKHQLLSKKCIEICLIKIPVLGKVVLITNRINFCYTLSMLLSAGVSLYDALTETIKHMTLPYSQDRLNQAFREVVLGKNLSTSLKATHFLPRSAIQTIAVAENTGRLDQAFKIIGQQFVNDLSVFSDHLGKIIEPFIIILLGGIIGAIVIAIYLPIFQLGSLY
ncbi:MAG: type II secretion system F family protein [Pseudomonadota bacterium]